MSDVNLHISGSVADAKEERMIRTQERLRRSLVSLDEAIDRRRKAAKPSTLDQLVAIRDGSDEAIDRRRKAAKPSTLDQLVAIRDKAMERAHHELDKFTELGLSSLDDATAAAHLGRAGVLYDLAGQLAGVITNIRQEQEK